MSSFDSKNVELKFIKAKFYSFLHFLDKKNLENTKTFYVLGGINLDVFKSIEIYQRGF